MFERLFPKIFGFFPENGGSNAYLLLGKREKALVDSSSAGNAPALKEGLSALGLSPNEISLILHTHGHADHFGSDFLFKKARVAMHSFDAERVNSHDQRFCCSALFPGTVFPKASVFVNEGLSFDLGTLKIRALHCPGHTQGSLCFLAEKQGILFSGDLVFALGFGRTDLASGSSKKLLQSLERLQKLRPKAILSGHGPALFGEKAAGRAIRESVGTARHMC